MKLPTNTINNEKQITNVTQFFVNIAKGYLQFEEDTLELIDSMADSSPEHISEQCKKLAQQRNQLAQMDEKMFEILDLAGKEICQDPMLYEYRVAFAKANMACNNLYQKLSVLKLSLQETESPPHSNSPV